MGLQRPYFFIQAAKFDKKRRFSRRVGVSQGEYDALAVLKGGGGREFGHSLH
jgi:hypothetical protein